MKKINDGLTKQQRLIKNYKEKGMVQISKWIPSHAYDDTMAMLNLIIEAKEKGIDVVLGMVRSVRWGTGFGVNQTVEKIIKNHKKRMAEMK